MMFKISILIALQGGARATKSRPLSLGGLRCHSTTHIAKQGPDYFLCQNAPPRLGWFDLLGVRNVTGSDSRDNDMSVPGRDLT